MTSVGNGIAKLMYEDGVPSNYPRNFTDQHQLVSWITNKYTHKKWYNELADPDLHPPQADSPSPQSTPSNDNFADFNAFASSTAFTSTAASSPAPLPTQPFDAFATPQPHSLSLPVTPTHSTSPFDFKGASEWTSASHSNPGEPDLFAIPSNGAQPTPSAASAQRPVDKSALMNIYSQSSLNQPQSTPQNGFQQNQQNQLLMLQQQAYLQQQQMLQQQYAFNNQWPSNMPAAPPHGTAQNNNFFAAPQPHHVHPNNGMQHHPQNHFNGNAFANFGAAPASTANFGFGAQPTSNIAPASHSSPAAASLASIYAQSPPTAMPTNNAQPTPNHGYNFGSSYPTASASLI